MYGWCARISLVACVTLCSTPPALRSTPFGSQTQPACIFSARSTPPAHSALLFCICTAPRWRCYRACCIRWGDRWCGLCRELSISFTLSRNANNEIICYTDRFNLPLGYSRFVGAHADSRTSLSRRCFPSKPQLVQPAPSLPDCTKLNTTSPALHSMRVMRVTHADRLPRPRGAPCVAQKTSCCTRGANFRQHV